MPARGCLRWVERENFVTSFTNLSLFDFFYLKFNYLYCSKNLCKHNQIYIFEELVLIKHATDSGLGHAISDCIQLRDLLYCDPNSLHKKRPTSDGAKRRPVAGRLGSERAGGLVRFIYFLEFARH